MPIPEKTKQLHTFEAGLDTDTAPEYVAPNKARYILNCRSFALGNIGVITNIQGNTLIQTPLPGGTNITIGSYPDEQNNRFFFFVYNSNGYHTIFLYNDITNQVVPVFQSITQSNGVDILKFSPDYLILHVDIVQVNLIYWTDGLNKARKFNIDKMMDSTPNGYGYAIFEDYITAYKQTSVFAPQCAYITDTTRNANNLYANLFRFTIRWHYDDGELSNWSDWSTVPLPTSQSYLGVGNITNSNNAIQVTVATGSSLVTKIEVAVKINNNQINAVNEIQTTDFVVCQLLNKDELNIADLSSYIWTFYNDGSYSTTDQSKIIRLNSYLPASPLCQSFVRSAMTYSNFPEGFASVAVDCTIVCTFTDLYVPSGVVNQLNNPSITVTQVSVNKEKAGFGPLSEVVRYDPTYKFEIGFDVKAGNTFYIYGTNGGTTDFFAHDPLRFLKNNTGADNYLHQYTANANDTAQTVASQLKQALRTQNRGYPNNQNAISNEGTDGSGNVFWNYGYLGKYQQTQTIFSGSVQPVSYESLKDDGTSLKLIKYGTVRNYAFVYDDDDGRESDGYTSSTCVIRTPFITEIGLNVQGDFQRPVHTLTINHKPPIWAKYWRLVRTPDTPSFIWLLIQQVIEVDADNGDGLYLDLAVGSLPTYNLLHPNSILAYDFVRGDRLRPVIDTGTGLLYSQYYDTEILNYQTETVQVVNSNIDVHGDTILTPAKAVLASQVGFFIQVNGIERLIVDVDLINNNYIVDEPVVGLETGSPLTTVTFPNFTLVDRRGTIRISKPIGITITPNSIVELYTPQPAAISIDYKIFNDFGQKYEILNWGTTDALHACNLQDQTDSLPGLVTVINGDAYIRNREYPTNTIFPGTQVVVNKAIDPNFSDFYYSDMTDLGRVYPQDLGLGVKQFGSRVRYSNNYIQDTSLNGLNDFDNDARQDYDDPYGDIMRTFFRGSKIYAFKRLKDTFISVNNVTTTSTDGSSILVGTGQLLNQMEYYNYDGGVGNNPESLTWNGDFLYHCCPSAGVFVKINTSYIYGRAVTDNIEAISEKFTFDLAAKAICALLLQYDLRLNSGFDRQFNEAIWGFLPYIPYLFKGGFNPNIWSVSQDITPAGTIGVVVTQPANGNVVYNGTTGNFEVTMNNNFAGTDGFTYKLQLPGGAFTAVKNECLTIVEPANRQKGFRHRGASAYCQQVQYVPPPVNNLAIRAQYGITITGISGVTTTPPINSISVPPGGSMFVAYTSIAANQAAIVSITGIPVNTLVELHLVVNGVVVFVQPIPNPPLPNYTVYFPATITNNPTPVSFEIDLS